MRLGVLVPIISLLLGSAGVCVADKTLQQKIDEKRAKAERMDEANRGRIYSELAVHQTDLANNLFVAGESDNAKKAVTDAVEYARKASASAKLKRKNIKQTEIHLRECSRRLEEISRTVTFLEREPIKEAAKQVDALRTELLETMFVPKEK
jgi:hypothetical protein